MSDTLPIGPPSAMRRAYSPFLIECTDTASVIVSTSPDCSPVIKIRKLQSAMSPKSRPRVTHKRTQQSLFSSLKILLNRSISCVASCSCRRSVPVLTITEITSQFAKWPQGEADRILDFFAVQDSLKIAAAHQLGPSSRYPKTHPTGQPC